MNLFEKEALINKAAEEYEKQGPEALIKWAVETFPNITLACSFGAEDVVLVEAILNLALPNPSAADLVGVAAFQHKNISVLQPMLLTLLLRSTPSRT